MLRIEVSTSYETPEVFAKYYLKAVKQCGMPVNVKVDDQTENSLVQSI